MGFGMAILMLLAIGGITYWNTAGLVSMANWMGHTHIVLDELKELWFTLTEMESGRRGYTLTGDGRYIATEPMATRAIEQALRHLRTLTADNPDQQGRLDVLAPLIAKRLTQFRESLTLQPPTEVDANAQGELIAQGQELMEAIRQVLTAMQHEEQALLQHRAEQAHRRSRHALLALLLGTLGSTVALVLVFTFLMREVTRRTRAEQALRDSEQRFRSVMQSAIDGIIAADAQGHIVTWNTGAQAIFGYREEEVLGRPLTLLMPARYRHAHQRGLQRLRATGTSQLIGKTIELEGVRKDGQEFPLELSLATWQAGAGRFYTGIVRDITARKQAEAALRRQTALIHLLQVSVTAANEASSLEEAMQRCLDQICAQTGWPVGHVYLPADERPGELVPTTIWHLDDPDRFAAFRSLTEATPLAAGAGLPGRVLASAAPVWIRDVTQDPHFLRAPPAQDLGVRAGFGFPVLVGSEVAAVLEFFATEAREPDAAFLEVMAHIGTQLGRVIERTRAEAALRRARDDLEQRVRERTAALAAANATLQEEIAERRRTEQALRESEARYRLLFEANPHPMWVYDVETLAFLAVNEAAVYQYGYSREEFLAMTIKDIRPPEDIPALLENIARTAPPLDPPDHWRHRRKDGTIIDVEITSHALTFAGRPARVVLAQDITARKQAEAALQRYAERLEILHEIDQAILAEQSPTAIADAALGHICALLSCWRAAITLFDFEGQQGVVFAWSGAGTARFPAGVCLPLAALGGQDIEALRAHEVYIVEDVTKHAALPATMQASQADGLRSYVRVPLVVGGELIGALSLLADRPGAFSDEDIDIAREVANQLAVALQQARLHEQVQRHAAELEARVRERTARLQEINAELESFCYSVSHDLRAPLRGVDGFSQALLEDYAPLLDAAGQDYLHRIRQAAQRMGNLIDALLLLSRVTRTELQQEPIDLSAMAHAIAAELQQQEPARDVTFVIGDGLQATGDPRLLRIVLENLLGNAWKFTAKHPQARIEVGGLPQPDGSMVYFARDDGAGFDMAYADRLFGAFQRLHRVHEFAGTGIGLATVQRIIHRHGGRVWAEAAVEQGATFYFTL
jgi:PAS domain S-box-containing protein